ncbi:MerR family transcriptional regulator [Sphingomonas sp. BN140010]|uniref:MerR family transcriptional regulator n=1 Tax=Sphingomonas arvum TaxID=2992113 RepID=A0ABT3JCW5_9SPHN|nr:MerR family transcriptional regulator [Sphingomonas sp. BN140010]MCW3796912.1 MerR family transcriptional regulator [Sphingomonas sp. BN140010]
MKPWIDPASRFTRQEFVERTRLSDDVLSFWSRRGLIVPEQGETGRGVHKRYHFSQLNIAAVLKVYRDHFGASIAVLSSLADLLQRSVASFANTSQPVENWDSAAALADALEKFRAGRDVPVRAYHGDEPDFLSLSIDERYRDRPAVSESEIIADRVDINVEGSSREFLRFTEKLGAGRYQEARIAQILLGKVLKPSTFGKVTWLMGQTDDGWDIREGHDDGFGDLDGLGPAVFMPVGSLIDQVWGIPSDGELRAMKERGELE